MSERRAAWQASNLSPRQERILAYLRGYVSEHGWPPSNREIGRACGISSTSVVAYNLHALQRRGYIEMGGGARMIRLVRENVDANVDQAVH